MKFKLVRFIIRIVDSIYSVHKMEKKWGGRTPLLL